MQAGKEKRRYFILFVCFALAILPLISLAALSTPAKTIIEVSDKQFQVDSQGKTAKAFD